ncbi:MAG: type II toxin-antitoxin system VapC family toxin [bacterium]|nr:MAG: type II toxin-antitoxin system VapC family toxin [bacterium]
MARFVVDAAVLLKWFIPEENSGQAARLLDGGNELLAPDTILTDAGKAICTKTRAGELGVEEAVVVLEAVRSAPVWLQPADSLLEPALRIAAQMDRPMGDGLVLALAVASDCRLVTASRKFYDGVQGTPFAAHVKWVGDLR